MTKYLEWINYYLVDRLNRSCGENKVLLPEPFTSTSIIHATMDNFDHIENSKSGKAYSHDTLVMLFHKQIFNLVIIKINICYNFFELISTK